MKYQLSKYIFTIEDNSGNLRMYNSLYGSKSLLIVPPSLKPKILEILNNCNQPQWNVDKHFNQLYEYGYIIESNKDETAIGKIIKNDIINYPGLMLTILPTEDCNFRCVYCYEDHKKGKMSPSVQRAIVKFVQKNIKNYTSLGVGWFGGEPLEALDVVENLSKNFIKICNVARKPYSAGMTTNGYNLDVPTFELLQQLKVYEYQVTIDSLKNIHDKYRCLKDGSGTFDRIINNINEIHKLKRNTYKMDIRTNLTSESIEVLPQYLKLCEDIFGGDPRFSLFVHLVGNWGGDSINSIDSQLISNNRYRDVLRSIIDLNPNVGFHAHLRDLDAYHSKCYAALRNSYVIGSDGKIYKCTEGFDMIENNIGYLNEDGDMIIDPVKHKKWLDINGDNNKICSQCAYWGCCLDGPCPKAKINSADNSGLFCPRLKKSVPEIMLLLNESFYQQL